MRIGLRGLADLTNVNAMLLPEVGPNLPGPSQYSGGITGLGQALGPDTIVSMQSPSTTGTPVTFSTTAWAMQSPSTVATACKDADGYPMSCPTGTPAGSTVPASYGLSPLNPKVVSPSGFSTQAACIGAGYSWNGTACVASSAISGTTIALIGGGALLLILIMVAVKR